MRLLGTLRILADVYWIPGGLAAQNALAYQGGLLLYLGDPLLYP